EEAGWPQGAAQGAQRPGGLWPSRCTVCKQIEPVLAYSKPPGFARTGRDETGLFKQCQVRIEGDREKPPAGSVRRPAPGASRSRRSVDRLVLDRSEVARARIDPVLDVGQAERDRALVLVVGRVVAIPHQDLAPQLVAKTVVERVGVEEGEVRV